MGKKYDNLIQDIADWDNLLLAYKKARKGKRNRAEVQLFSSDLWLHLGNICRDSTDCLAIFQTKAEAEFYLSEITTLSTQLGLAFSKTSVHRASQGVNMLGYRIWPTHKLIRKRAIVKFRKDIKFILKRQYRSEHLTKLLIKRIKSFHAHTQHANAKKLFNAMCTGLL